MIKDLAFRKVAPKVATQKELANLEASLDFRLPATFHEFCFRWNGGFPTEENSCYIVPSSCEKFYEIMFGGKKTEGAAVQISALLGATEELKPCNILHEFQLCAEAERLFGRMKPLFIPIATNLVGEMAVLRVDSPSQKIYWFGKEFEMPEGIAWGTTPGNPEARPALMPIAESLEAFYNGLTLDPDR